MIDHVIWRPAMVKQLRKLGTMWSAANFCIEKFRLKFGDEVGKMDGRLCGIRHIHIHIVHAMFPILLVRYADTHGSWNERTERFT